MLEHFSVAAMDAGSWLALALALLALAPLAALGRWARRRARLVRLVQRIPGPTALPLIGSLGLLMGVKREDLFTVFTEITRHYWPIMRFWKGSRAEIHLLRAEEAEVILSSTTHLTKSENYNFLRPWLGNGLLTGGGSKWHAHRKLITPTFHFKILESFLEVFIEKSQVLVEVLEKELDNTKGFDVFPYITLCTLDVICETAMGTQINAQHGAHSDYVKALYDVCEGFVQRVLRPWLHSDFVFYRSKRGKAFTKALSEVHGFTNKVIRDRKNSRKCNSNRTHEEEPVLGAKRRLAFLDLLLEASGDGASLTDEEIRQEVDTFMFAGHDTTAAGICWALFLLGSHPEAQVKYERSLPLYLSPKLISRLQNSSWRSAQFHNARETSNIRTEKSRSAYPGEEQRCTIEPLRRLLLQCKTSLAFPNYPGMRIGFKEVFSCCVLEERWKSSRVLFALLSSRLSARGRVDTTAERETRSPPRDRCGSKLI